MKTHKTAKDHSKAQKTAALRAMAERTKGGNDRLGLRNKPRSSTPRTNAIPRVSGKLGNKTSSAKVSGGKKTVSSKVVPSEPTVADVVEREAVARTFFNSNAAAAARAAFRVR